MKTRSDFRMPQSVVWLLLVAVLCVAILPAVAVAKVDMTIATEGDPTDGLDSDGGSGSAGSDGFESNSEIFSPEVTGQNRGHYSFSTIEYVHFIPVWVNGHFVIFDVNLYRIYRVGSK